MDCSTLSECVDEEWMLKVEEDGGQVKVHGYSFSLVNGIMAGSGPGLKGV